VQKPGFNPAINFRIELFLQMISKLFFDANTFLCASNPKGHFGAMSKVHVRMAGPSERKTNQMFLKQKVNLPS
jgi:hypothetical protein